MDHFAACANAVDKVFAFATVIISRYCRMLCFTESDQNDINNSKQAFKSAIYLCPVVRMVHNMCIESSNMTGLVFSKLIKELLSL